MRIGSVNSNMDLWANVYDTGHGDEVEFVDYTFHRSWGEANDWIKDLYKKEDYINLRSVKVEAMFQIA